MQESQKCVSKTNAALLLFRRRRPFLIRSLENTLVKLILSLEFYDAVGREKIAICEPPLLQIAYAVEVRLLPGIATLLSAAACVHDLSLQLSSCFLALLAVTGLGLT